MAYQTSLAGSVNAADMWRRLNQEHAQVAAANSGQLTAKFFQYTMHPDHSVTAHINTLKQMSDELSNVGAPVSYDQLEERILSTLPPSFTAVRAAWETQVQGADRNITRLTARMVLEETRIKSSGGENPADIAFFAMHPSRIKKQTEENADTAFVAQRGRGRGYRARGRGSNNNRGRGRGSSNGSKPPFGPDDCYNCGWPGHLARNCWGNKHQRNARHEKFNSNRSFGEKGENNNRQPAANLMSSFCFIANNENDWYADSGATHHMTDKKHFFTSFESVKPGSWHVYGIGGIKLEVLGVGDIEIETVVNGEKKSGKLNGVLFVPKIGANLFSLGTVMDRGFRADFDGDDVKLIDKKTGTIVLEARKLGKSLFHMKFTAAQKDQQSSAATASKKSSYSLKQWHRKFGHASPKVIKQMAKIGAVTGLHLNKESEEDVYMCEGCIYGAMHRSPFRTSKSRATEVGELIHTDVCIVNVPTPKGETCVAIFKDDYSGLSKGYLMKNKGEAAAKSIQFIAWLERQTGKKVKTLRNDGGVEYKRNKEYREENGIEQQTSNRYTPQENSRSEREMRRVMEPTRKTIHMTTKSCMIQKGDR